ncbi:MAG: DUF2442 domain-containing protein [Cyclobacteriaceae bacterium]
MDSYRVLCIFENGERRILNLHEVLDKSDKYASKLFEEEIYKEAKVGSLGQIYWNGIAEMTNLDGTSETCEYDISPEFAYHNSSEIGNK